ncbi:DEAD/DEAH box helicase [Sagittula sp. S175]|uniref:DEAD/DEAH box helicase n=1 Tax=Sagittula sp. S175 TaxID=3415129 RepID=UPI003C79D82E
MLTPLNEALAERGYTTLTDVQQAVTAPELAEQDLLVSAQTGSGKTVGFGLAIAPTLLGEDGTLPPPAAPMALVVAPTRELALQVQRELSWLYAKTGAWVVSCIGGMDARTERRALERGAHIVVGTPGRLRDHIERGSLDLSALRAIVLDEADEMLDLGFREDLEFMLSESPEDRRTLLFSATVPPAIARLAESYQRDAQRITTQVKGEQHSDIEYRAVQCIPSDVEHAIINLLRYHDAPNAIVFANTRAAVNRLVARFANRGFAVVALSGELSQDERSHALQALRDGRAKVCVATDVAARGIDLPNLELVIHADLPSNTETLTHRSGRTGRAGRKGTSALIVSDRDVKKAQRLLGWAKIDATWGTAPSPEEIAAKDEERLMALPAWSDPITEEEAAFAARLIDSFSTEQIAAACLRMYQKGLSAPEELHQPGTKTERAERAPFGPSKWVALSVGRDQGAEPRWLLPLLLRAGNIDKAQIGRIRVADTETYVEVAEAGVQPLLNAVDGQGVLEKDITLRALDGEPDMPQRPGGGRPGGKPGGRPDGRFGGKPFDKGPRHGGRKDFGDSDRPRPPRKDSRPPRDESRTERPRADASADKPKPRAEKTFEKREPRSENRAESRPAKSFDKRPAARRDDAPAEKPKTTRPNAMRTDMRMDAPRGKDGDRKTFGKPKGKPGDAPFKGKGKPGDKPFKGKPAGKSSGKPYAGKPGSDARPDDPRFKVKSKGGDAAPSRKPRAK